MKSICERVRDDLPRHVAGTLGAAGAQEVEAHLERCAACREEHALIVLLRSPVEVPAGLEARVRRAAATPPVRRGIGAGLAAAATIALVIAGSAVALQLMGGDEATSAIGGVPEADNVELGWAARTDPLLHGGPSLGALSDEELEFLLEEMQS